MLYVVLGLLMSDVVKYVAAAAVVAAGILGGLATGCGNNPGKC